MKKILFTLLAFGVGFLAKAQHYDLDPTFGEGGLAMTAISPIFNQTNTSLVQSDGKVIVAGNSGAADSYQMSAARFNQDGSLDMDFADNGHFYYEAAIDGTSYTMVAQQQADGKIILGGYIFTNTFVGDVAVLRLNLDGSLDESFGDNGLARIDSGGDDILADLKILEDGKILITGYTDDDFMLVRLNENGDIDTSFGTSSGWSHTAFENYAFSYAQSLTIDAEENILVAGFAIGDSYEMVLVRYDSNGIIDSSFGVSGARIFNIEDNLDFGIGVMVQSDGKIVLAGHVNIPFQPITRYDIMTIRMNHDGSVDTSYGENGYARTVIMEAANYVSHALMQEDDKVVIFGNITTGDYEYLGVTLRLNTDGSLDPTFGSGGYSIIESTDVTIKINGGSIGPNGEIVSGGQYDDFVDDVMYMFAARYVDMDEMGTVDTTLGEIKVYPNPISDYLALNLPASVDFAKVQIFAMNGQLIQTTNTKQGEKINVSSLPAGVYVVKINTGNQVVTTKVVKK